MSFSFDFVAQNRATALAEMEKQYCVTPGLKAAIAAAIMACPEGLILVKGNGHLANKPGEHSYQNANFEVRPLTVV